MTSVDFRTNNPTIPRFPPRRQFSTFRHSIFRPESSISLHASYSMLMSLGWLMVSQRRDHRSKAKPNTLTSTSPHTGGPSHPSGIHPVVPTIRGVILLPPRAFTSVLYCANLPRARRPYGLPRPSILSCLIVFSDWPPEPVSSFGEFSWDGSPYAL